MAERMPAHDGLTGHGVQDSPNNPHTDDSLENDWVGTKEYWSFVAEAFNDECGIALSQAEQAACEFVYALLYNPPYVAGGVGDIALKHFERDNKQLMEKLEQAAITRKRGEH